MAGEADISITGLTEAVYTMSTLYPELDAALHANAPELGIILTGLVQEKTPVLTGGLISDITWTTDTGTTELVKVYSGTEGQMASWQRVYVEYQEGPPLGLSTYTNEPHQMFLQTAQGDGRDATEVWAMTVAKLVGFIVV